MSNIIDSRQNYNSNVIAANKLKDNNTGSRRNLGLINLPETTYKYSTDEYSKEMQALRDEAKYENYLYEERQKKSDKFFSLLFAGIYTGAVYLVLKHIKLPRKWL